MIGRDHAFLASVLEDNVPTLMVASRIKYSESGTSLVLSPVYKETAVFNYHLNVAGLVLNSQGIPRNGSNGYPGA